MMHRNDPTITMDAVHELLIRSSEHSPSAIALRQGERTLSYAELASSSADVAFQLRAAGVEPGDRVVTVFEKSFANIIAMFGVWAVGGVVVNLNSKLPANMLQSVIADCDPRCVLAGESLEQAFQEIAPSKRPKIIVISDERQSRSVMAHDRTECARVQSDLATIVYTSGSTGRQKGVMLSHANLLHHVRTVSGYLHNTAHDRLISVLPLYFGYGLSQLLTAVGVGASLSLVESFVYPQQVLDVMEQHRITGMAGVPAHFQMLLSHGSLGSRDLSPLRYITISGSVSPGALVVELRRALPHVQIYLMFGQTESCIRSCYLPP
jgi:acyl-CoA synthetase (AMP-forming)/AMP-acid ligase II